MDLAVGYSSEEEIERRVDPPVAQAAPPALNVFARMMTQAKAAASLRNAPKRKEPMNISDVNMPVDSKLQAAGSVEGDRAAEVSVSSKDDSNYCMQVKPRGVTKKMVGMQKMMMPIFTRYSSQVKF